KQELRCRFTWSETLTVESRRWGERAFGGENEGDKKVVSEYESLGELIQWDE
ncbi:hypothetical protein U1Q18_000856, partial [Sarracenia purpurea var. burkii]